jgi:hypothetical protein
MTSPPRTPREEERRLNLRTLVIASAASATAALVTSRLWIAGTWLAAAMTPVLVALVSELLHRPTDRIARSLTTDSPALPDPEAPARRVAERLRADAPVPDPDAPGSEAPVRIYRSESGRPPAGRKRQIAYRVVFATAALAFVIAVLALTVPELIAGGSFGKSDGRTTFFSGSGKKKTTHQNGTASPTTTGQTDTSEQTTPQTDTTTTPTNTTTTPTDTAPTTTPTDTTSTTTTTP